MKIDKPFNQQVGTLYQQGYEGVRTLVVGDLSSQFAEYMIGRRRLGDEAAVADFFGRVARLSLLCEPSAADKTLLQTIDMLAPEVIFSLEPLSRDFLMSHGDKFRVIGRAELPGGEQTWLFTPVENEVTGRKLGRLRYRRKVVSMRHQEDWFRDRVREHLSDALQGTPFEKRRQIRALAALLKDMSDRKLLGSDENGIYFRDTEKYKWRSVHIGIFIKKLKAKFSLGRGANEGLNALFCEKAIEKCSANPSQLSSSNHLLRLLEAL